MVQRAKPQIEVKFDPHSINQTKNREDKDMNETITTIDSSVSRQHLVIPMIDDGDDDLFGNSDPPKSKLLLGMGLALGDNSDDDDLFGETKENDW